jgi:hypothetical protein
MPKYFIVAYVFGAIYFHLMCARYGAVLIAKTSKRKAPVFIKAGTGRPRALGHEPNVTVGQRFAIDQHLPGDLQPIRPAIAATGQHHDHGEQGQPGNRTATHS